MCLAEFFNGSQDFCLPAVYTMYLPSLEYRKNLQITQDSYSHDCICYVRLLVCLLEKDSLAGLHEVSWQVVGAASSCGE